MRTPDYWHHDSAPARILAPLAALYAAAGRLRRRLTTGESVGVPVICVGNLTAGGAGKTPVALAIAKFLGTRGVGVHFLSRGYGGRLAGPLQVDPARHDAGDVGDEPLLLAAQAPTWTARNRVAGARAAVAAGAQVIVMDDGFQNPSLHKDWSVLVVDGGYGFGNGRVHPAGPLRETLAEGLARADAMIVIDPDDHPADDFGVVGALPYVHARLVPEDAAAVLRGRRVLAFAGIGRPEKFFATVRALGAELVDQQGFADHHAYRGDEIMALIDRAHAHDALAVTTAKDAVRLPAEARAMVQVIGVELAFDDDGILKSWLSPILREIDNG